MATEAPASPYKFLDPYGSDDRELFFGRERETQIFLADVIVSRLVVLFARTGTGKTSLIDAGVRPELEARGYATFTVRVQQDPAESARRELLADPRISALPRAGFPSETEDAVTQLGQPIVIFFDQFEEFFVYLMSRRDTRPRGRQFISDVGALHADMSSGVHLVFSMREDFMADMDEFRDEIPTIFHQDSNLRLRWFDDDQARAAISGPARVRGVPMESGLVERMIDDLRDEDGIEPAQVQVICDTLWRRAGDGRIMLSDYEALGARPGGGTIATRILKGRLEEEFAKIQSKPELELLARLLPLLRTPQGTKYIRDVPSLVRELEADEELLRSTLAQLEDRSRLTRTYGRDGLEYVELTHDYLVSHLEDLSASVGVIWPRRVLLQAMAGDGGELDQEELEDVLERVRAEHHRAREAGRPAAGDLPLDAGETAFLLRFALATGMQASICEDAFRIATEHGADAVAVVEDALSSEGPVAETAVELASQLGGDLAAGLLTPVIARADDRARHAVEMLGRVDEGFAVDLLAEALRHEELAPGPELALTTLAGGRRDHEVAGRAATAVVSHLRSRIETGDDVRAIAGLGRIAHPAAVAPLEAALRQPRLVDAARAALLQIAQALTPAAAREAKRALLGDVERSLPDVPADLVDSLGAIDDVAAVRALEAAIGYPALAGAAEQALLRLHRSRRPDVVGAAQEALERAGAVRSVPPEAGGEHGPAVEPQPPVVSPGPLTSHFRLVARALLEGRVIPFLGNGVNLAARPEDERWVLGRNLPTGAELAMHLGDRFAYPEPELDLLRVAQYGALLLGRGVLEHELRSALLTDMPPTPVHELLAGLPDTLRRHGGVPSPQLIVTTNFDDALERAFAAQGEEFDVVRYLGGRGDPGRWVHVPAAGEPLVIERPLEYDMSGSATVILKLQGSIDRADPEQDSFVITEDDYLDYAAEMDIAATLPVTLAARLRRSHFLFLGYSLRDWNIRLMLHRLWGRTRLTYKSWAVLRSVNVIEQALWERRDVEIIDQPLAEYTRELHRHLDATEAVT